MKQTSQTIGSFEAKTHLSSLLQKVQHTGSVFVITKHGQPIARLQPYLEQNRKTPKEVFNTLHDIRLSIKDQIHISDYILEGRKH